MRSCLTIVKLECGAYDFGEELVLSIRPFLPFLAIKKREGAFQANPPKAKVEPLWGFSLQRANS